MCGRFVMFRSLDEYVQELDPQGDLFAKVDKTPIGRYNIAPVQTFLSFTPSLTARRSRPCIGVGNARCLGRSRRLYSRSMPESKP